MKHFLITASFLFAGLFLFNSCKQSDPIAPVAVIPKPTAQFTHYAGNNGVILFENKSTDYQSVNWDYGDGQTSNTDDQLHGYARNGVYQVTLTVRGKGGSDVIVKNVVSSGVKGSVVFWINFSTTNINVYVDGNYKGQIGGYYSSGTPSCGGQYCVTASDLTEGIHSFSAKETGKVFPREWSSSVNITGGVCKAQQLSK